MACAHDQISAERVDFLRGVADVEFLADHCAHVVETGAAGGQERAVVLSRHGGGFGFVVLVGDIADDQLDQVFDRDEAIAAAVFVDHESEVDTRCLHLGEQIERRHGRRHVEDLADDLGGRQRHGKIDLHEVQTGCAGLPRFLWFLRFGGGGGGRIDHGPRRHEPHEIADVHHADRVVERVVINNKPGMTGARIHHDEFADRNILLHGHDVGSRQHDAFDPAFAQAEDVLEHRCFGRRESRFRLLCGQDELKIGACGRAPPSKQDTCDAREPTLMQFARFRHDHGKTAMLGLVLVGS